MWEPKWNHSAAEEIPVKQQPEVWSIDNCDPAPAVWGKKTKQNKTEVLQLIHSDFNLLDCSQQWLLNILYTDT